MIRHGACPCGGVQFTVDGPVRHLLVCHCDACRVATGGPWAASAAYRRDLSVAGTAALAWEEAEVSEYGASRGRCAQCGATVFWDAPGRETVSFAAAALIDAPALEVVAHIWVSDLPAAHPGEPQHHARGLPDAVVVPWRS